MGAPALGDMNCAEPCPAALQPFDKAGISIPILMYHKIGPVAHSPFWVSTESFRAQMRALRAHGYESITLDMLYAAHQAGAPLPDRPVLITFDDGYEGLLTEALPVLAHRKVGFTATCFLPTGRVGGSNAWDAGDCQPEIRHLNWKQVTRLQRGGVFDFQAHTVTHPRLTDLADDPQALDQELAGCREELSSRLNKSVDFISWPFGAYDARVVEAARRAGYRGGLDAQGGLESLAFDPWAVKRIMIHRDGTMIYDPMRAGYPLAAWLKRHV